MSLSQSNGVAASKEATTARLESRFAVWASLPLWQHGIAIILLAALLGLRWWRHVTTPLLMNDEMIYFAAFRNVAKGLSPFERSGYLSFSLLAHLGGWALDRLGQGPTLALMRTANLLGIATAVWCSLAWAPWAARRRWLVGAAYLLLAPAVGFGMLVSNLSLAVSGMLIVGLMIWPRKPILSGSLLAGSIIAKPLAPGAILALLAHRPADRSRTHLVAGGCAALFTVIIVLGAPELERALALDPWFRLSKTVSPHRLAFLLDARAAVPWVSVAIGVLTVWIARRRPLGPTQLLALAVTAAVATTPVVWSHTLLLTLPLQVLAVAILAERYPRRGADSTPLDDTARNRRSLEIGAIVLAVAAIQLSTGATNIYDYHPVIQWMGSIPPIAAPWLLLAYVLRQTRPF